MRFVPEEITCYALEHTAQENGLLQELVRYTERNTKAPRMQVGHLEGAFLRLLLRLANAKRVLEIGTFTGYSALVMAEALPEEGELITCDIDPVATQIAQTFWGRSDHGRKIHLRLGPALETIAGLKGTFDAAFIDADKENYVSYWEAIVPRIRAGGLLIADNVLWSGKVLAPKEMSDHALVAFNRHVKKDERVEAVMLPIRDGITLAWKK